MTLIQRRAYNITDILSTLFDPANSTSLIAITVELSRVHNPSNKLKFVVWKGTELFKVLTNTADDKLDLEEIPIIELHHPFKYIF